jgi:hypothetical protein
VLVLQNTCAKFKVLMISKSLNYKDFHTLVKPAPLLALKEMSTAEQFPGRLEIVESVKGFSYKMDQFGLLDWWRLQMGFINENAA